MLSFDPLTQMRHWINSLETSDFRCYGILLTERKYYIERKKKNLSCNGQQPIFHYVECFRPLPTLSAKQSPAFAKFIRLSCFAEIESKQR